MGIIVSAAADPLYVIPMWIFDCVMCFSLGVNSTGERVAGAKGNDRKFNCAHAF